MTTCPSKNLRQVSVLVKMKIENALFCIISISLPSAIWADLGRSGRIFAKNKTRWTLCIFFSKIVHQKGVFEKIKKNSNFWCCLGILDIYGRAFLRKMILVSRNRNLVLRKTIVVSKDSRLKEKYSSFKK